ncbi:MAG: chromosome partitioning protein [Planctomycetota bacterium]|jgi:chromosome partitioning protein
MSRIVAVVNSKRGVGKTTTALSLAQAFALGGQGALLLDLDHEDGVSKHLGVARPRSGLFGRILAGQEDPTSVGLLVRSVAAGLDVVPSDVTDDNTEPAEGAVDRLYESLHVLRFQYPWCVIDCPSALNGWTKAAIGVSDTVVVPVEAELLARESTSQILDFIRDVEPGPSLGTKTTRILMTRFLDKNSLSSDVKRDLSFEYPGLLSPTVVPRDEQVEKCRIAGESLLQHSLESRAARAYVQFAKEVMTYDGT